MKKDLSKSEVKEKIQKFCSEIKEKTPKKIKKIKKLAMDHNAKLGKFRKKFCKRCLNPYADQEKIRIKNKLKTIICNNCGHVSRWRVK